MPADLAAQLLRLPDAELGAESWTLDLGTASSSATSITVLSAGIGLRLSRGLSIHIRGSTAPEKRVAPGVRAVSLLVRGETPRGADRFGVFAALGPALMRWDADKNERIRRECTATCFFEGVGYQSGREFALVAYVGARLPLASALTIEPRLGGSLPFGAKTGGRVGEGTRSVRLAVQLGWRP